MNKNSLDTKHISVTESRRLFLPLLKQINDQPGRIIIENHKRPVAVMMSYSDYKKLTK